MGEGLSTVPAGGRPGSGLSGRYSPDLV